MVRHPRVIVRLFVIVALASGCFPETHAPACWVSNEAERVGLAYEGMHDVALTDDDFACLHDFRVAFVSRDDFNRWCPSATNSYACYHYSSLDKRDRIILFVGDEYTLKSEYEQLWMVRHELVHHLLMCVTGDADVNHDSRDMINDSLVIYARDVKTAWTCDEYYYDNPF